MSVTYHASVSSQLLALGHTPSASTQVAGNADIGFTVTIYQPHVTDRQLRAFVKAYPKSTLDIDPSVLTLFIPQPKKADMAMWIQALTLLLVIVLFGFLVMSGGGVFFSPQTKVNQQQQQQYHPPTGWEQPYPPERSDAGDKTPPPDATKPPLVELRPQQGKPRNRPDF